jgi:hypothetical protein
MMKKSFSRLLLAWARPRGGIPGHNNIKIIVCQGQKLNFSQKWRQTVPDFEYK